MNFTEMNQTAAHARIRVYDARTASLAGTPTIDYLTELSHLLSEWDKLVQEKLSSTEISQAMHYKKRTVP